MKGTPLVSIIIPVYNGDNYVAEAIESALAQTYSDIEVIVIDDGSSDGGATAKIVEQYIPRIRYIKKENGGVATALNRGIREMRGEYFSWLSHDDLYSPNKIKDQIDFLSSMNFPDVIVYSGHTNLVEECGKLSVIRHAVYDDLEFRAREIVANNQIHGCTLLIPYKAFDQVGLFDEKLRVAQDYELWFRMAEKYPFRYLDMVVTTGRVHGKQTGKRLHDRVIKENDQFRLNCINHLHVREIVAMGAGSYVRGLLRLSMRMYKMGCPISHSHLSGRLKELVTDRSKGGAERLTAAFALGVDAFYTAFLQVARKSKTSIISKALRLI
ncbi:glycosyltransferase [Stutzerimonas nitrititolerans]|uniref:glycosyltransferase n=1 Tax=Stutzerimonas nitrititolerans TaxID=2482751 RepID=UPI0028A2D23E|nr:glycosyltransferase [Stutzerimonas nitrititolerans]